MQKSKFDDYADGRYLKSYFHKDKRFYKLIRAHLSKIKEGSIGLDIGCGPGIAALLLEELKVRTRLIGYEPSKTYLDAKALSGKLKYVKFEPRNKPMKDIRKRDFDYILLLRSSHEIALSLGSKRLFFDDFHHILTMLKPGGRLIVAEPQYADEIYKSPNRFRDIIAKARIIQNQRIGHSHAPKDYITYQILEKHLTDYLLTNLDFTKQTIKVENGYPLIFYVITFVKIY